MPRVETLRIVACTQLPEKAKMEPGILYVSHEYEICSHLCACGCGEDVPLPILPWFSGWKLDALGDVPHMRPSIQQTFACKSHYYITQGSIEWL